MTATPLPIQLRTEPAGHPAASRGDDAPAGAFDAAYLAVLGALPVDAIVAVPGEASGLDAADTSMGSQPVDSPTAFLAFLATPQGATAPLAMAFGGAASPVPGPAPGEAPVAAPAVTFPGSDQAARGAPRADAARARWIDAPASSSRPVSPGAPALAASARAGAPPSLPVEVSASPVPGLQVSATAPREPAAMPLAASPPAFAQAPDPSATVVQSVAAQAPAPRAPRAPGVNPATAAGDPVEAMPPPVDPRTPTAVPPAVAAATARRDLRGSPTDSRAREMQAQADVARAREATPPADFARAAPPALARSGHFPATPNAVTDAATGERLAAAMTEATAAPDTATPTPAASAASRAPGASPAPQLPPIAGDPGTAPWRSAFAERVTLHVKSGDREARLQLHPADLGPIDVRIRVDGDTTTLSFDAVRPETRQAIEDALPKLRELFAGNGLLLGDAQVGHDRRPGGDPAGATRAAPGDERRDAKANGQGEARPARAVDGARVDLYA